METTKKRPWLVPAVVVAVSIAGVGVILARRASHHGGPPPTASVASMKMDGGAARGAKIFAAIKANGEGGPPVVLADEPPVAAPSDAPSADEWEHARRAQLQSLPRYCTAAVIREWVRIHCDDTQYGSVAILAGSADGVDVAASDEGSVGADVVMPVRRGDRRVIQLNQQSFGGYEGRAQQLPGETISETWLDDARGPVILVD